MATLVPTPKKLMDALEFKTGEDYAAYHKRSEAAFAELQKVSDELPVGEVVGAILSFPYADGKAFYQVLSTKPLRLCHIPYVDAYHVGDPTIRGLRLADIKAMVAQDRRWREMFPPFKGAA